MSFEYKSLSQILQSFIKDRKLEEAFERLDINEMFKEVVGEQIAKQVKIKNFKKGILTLEIESSVWKNEIFLLRNQIIDKLNNKFGKTVVEQIVIL